MVSACPPGRPTPPMLLNQSTREMMHDTSRHRAARGRFDGRSFAGACASPAPAPLPYATTKVPGTDNVYIFRYQGHQAMFVVTPDGVIATDPIGERRPAAEAYIAGIRKITQAPIR